MNRLSSKRNLNKNPPTMRHLLFLSFTLLSVGASAQFSDFGSVSANEMDMKTCTFDPEASAVVLLDEGYSDYTDDRGLMTYYHKRIKVLKEDGIKYGDVKFTYYSDDDFESVDNIEAISINADENGRRRDIAVENKSIYTKRVSKYRTEISFAFPNVKAGTILEYKYRINAKHYGGLRDWYFQSEIPVVKSSYRLKVVPGHEISYLVQYNPNYKVNVSRINNDQSIKFEMGSIPALTDEPFMDAREDYIQKVIFQTTKYTGSVGVIKYMTTWKEVNRELYGRSDFGRQLKIKIDECQDFINTSLNGKTELEKVQLIHHYVSGNLAWDGINSLIADGGIKNLWKKKTGNSAEINLLLVNLLREAGLQAYPMLVSERGHGRVNKNQPFINQFNSVYAAVFVGDKKYYLDATDKLTPCLITPYSILNSTAFIADNDAGGLVDIQENDIRYTDNVTISADLSEAGELSGKVNVESKDYARAEKIRWYTRSKTDYVDNYIKSGMVNIEVNNFDIKNIEQENLPVTQAFDFKTNIQTTGEYSFLSFNWFTGFQNNPFIVNDRFSNINFGYKKTINLTYLINLPPNAKIDAIPKGIKLVNPGKTVTFTRQFFQEGSKLMAKIRVDIDKTLFGVDEYGQVQDFFKQMVNLMNEQVILKSK
jgi:hypothetical protein